MGQWTRGEIKNTDVQRWKCYVGEHLSLHKYTHGHTHTLHLFIAKKGCWLRGDLQTETRPEADILPTSCVNLNTENTAESAELLQLRRAVVARHGEHVRAVVVGLGCSTTADRSSASVSSAASCEAAARLCSEYIPVQFAQ